MSFKQVLNNGLRIVAVAVIATALASCASGRNGAAGGVNGADGAYASGAGGAGGFGNVMAYANRADLRQYHTIYFDYDSNVIHPWGLHPIIAGSQEGNARPAAIEVVHAYAAYLLNHPDAKVRLEGNTDARGSSEYNIALGERRANAVADIFRMDGVSARQIDVVSYGKERPVAMGTSEQAYSQNRRVGIKFE